jgi:hypothetical protein
MGCEIDRDGDIVRVTCSRGQRSRPCTFPGCTKPGDLLCDFPVGDGRTCDRRICRRHGTRVGPNKDYCITHPRETTEGGEQR